MFDRINISIVSICLLAILMAGGCSPVEGPRYWWDDQSDEKLPNDYMLPESPPEYPVPTDPAPFVPKNLPRDEVQLATEEEKAQIKLGIPRSGVPDPLVDRVVVPAEKYVDYNAVDEDPAEEELGYAEEGYAEDHESFEQAQESDPEAMDFAEEEAAVGGDSGEAKDFIDEMNQDYKTKKLLKIQYFQANRIKTSRLDNLNRINDAYDIFVKGMSHNFNNMFGGIIGIAQLLENLKLDNPKVKRYARMIKATSENGARLVAQLLEFSQSSDYAFERVNVDEIIEEAVAVWKKEVLSEIDISIKLNAKNKNIIGDADKLLLVFRNLIDNAFEAVKDGDNPIIEFTTANVSVRDVQASRMGVEPGEYIKITLADNGPGISEDIRNKIFEPFFSTSDLSEANGLGLAEARGVIHGHNGAIDCKNREEGGAEFTVIMPLGKKIAHPVLSASSGDVEFGAYGKILLVDDEELSLLFAREILRKSGYFVETAVNGEEALALYKVEKDNIDLVLTDIIMPKLNGIELAQELKKVNPEVKIIYMTGHSINLDEDELSNVEAAIKKPFRGAEIINLINRILEDG